MYLSLKCVHVSQCAIPFAAPNIPEVFASMSVCPTDAIREMRKYSGELAEQSQGNHGHHLDAEMQAHMRLFRAQRNFYISGFSLFLWVWVSAFLNLSHVGVLM